jgi:hypothetical protein
MRRTGVARDRQLAASTARTPRHTADSAGITLRSGRCGSPLRRPVEIAGDRLHVYRRGPIRIADQRAHVLPGTDQRADHRHASVARSQRR